jgi:hypothetical protein
MALASVDMETEMTYIRRERDWAERASAEGRPVAPTRLLPMLPAAVAAQIAKGGDGNGHGHGNGNGQSYRESPDGPGERRQMALLDGVHGSAGDHVGHGHG